MNKRHAKTDHRSVSNTGTLVKYSLMVAIMLVVISAFAYIDVINRLASSYSSTEVSSVQGVSDTKVREEMMKNALRCRPVLQKPANRAVIDTTSGFAWKIECAEKVYSYQMRITGAGIRPIVIKDIATTSHILADTSVLKAGKKYMWSVGACLRIKKTARPTIVVESNVAACDSYKWAEPRAFFWMSKPAEPSKRPMTPTPTVTYIVDPTNVIGN